MDGLCELILGHLKLLFDLIRFKGMGNPVATDEEDTESLWPSKTKII